MKKVCFVSFSRSDYTSLRPVIREALREKAFEVQVIAGGSHLLSRFGKSIDKFQEDEIPVDRLVDFLTESDDSELEIAKALGRAYPQIVDHLSSLRPDFVFILGDRWEMLAVANAASLLKIPIVHHSGGDITQGALDNQIRYALTAQAHLHLVALDEHRRRLIAVGEESWRVVTTGEPALTEVKSLAGSAGNIHDVLGVPEDQEFVLATFHPTSFDSVSAEDQLTAFLRTLDLIDENIVLTAPNPDPGSRRFLEAYESYVSKNPRVILHKNLGSARYYAAMANAKFMVGNSSSGIWEAPSFALPALNIGERQRDRMHAANVVDTSFDLPAIKSALEKVRSETFRASLKGLKNPYGHNETKKLILEAIQCAPARDKLLSKKFVDPLKNSANVDAVKK